MTYQEILCIYHRNIMGPEQQEVRQWVDDLLILHASIIEVLKNGHADRCRKKDIEELPCTCGVDRLRKTNEKLMTKDYQP